MLNSGTTGPALPPREPHTAAAATIAELGARQVNLYRALANPPDLLAAWLQFSDIAHGTPLSPGSPT